MNPLSAAPNIPLRMPLSPAEALALATEVAAIPKRKLAELLAKAQARIETFTRAESETFRDWWVLAMTRRVFLEILGKGAQGLALFGLSPKLPGPSLATDLERLTRINQGKGGVIFFFNTFFYSSAEPNELYALKKRDPEALSLQQLQDAKTLDLQDRIKRIIRALKTQNFGSVDASDWGHVHQLQALLNGDGAPYVQPETLWFFRKYILPRLELSKAEIGRLGELFAHCNELCRVRAEASTRTHAQDQAHVPYDSGIGTGWLAHLVKIRAGAEEARAHYDECVKDYQAEAPDMRGD